MTLLGYILTHTTQHVECTSAEENARLNDGREEDEFGTTIWFLRDEDEPCEHCVCDNCGDYIYPEYRS